MKCLSIALLVVGCSGSAHEQTQKPTLVPPSAVVEDCSNGCSVVGLDTAGTDVSYLLAPDTVMTFDLYPNLCARLTTSEGSASQLRTVDSGYELEGCQTFDNKNVVGAHMMPLATAPGVDAWLRVETGAAAYPGYCELSCNR